MILTTAKAARGARKGDVIDYTRFRLGSMRGRIVVCPTCGQRGRLVRYLKKGIRHAAPYAPEEHDGSGVVTHRTQHAGWCWKPPSQSSAPGCESPTPDFCYFKILPPELAVEGGTP